MPTRAIGVFDSGLGGLSVVRDIAALLPHESLLYIADSRHAPYGEKPPAFIVARSLAVCDWLVAQGAKALVVACNTATAYAVGALRARHPGLPVIGVEPGLKPAAAASRSGVVGVLATENTLASEKFRQLLAALPETSYHCRAGRGLVARVEAGEVDSPEVEALLREYLLPMVAAGADTLVLGCTHYPFLAPAIERVLMEAGATLRLIDTGEAVARQLQRRLAEHALLASTGAVRHRFCSTREGVRLEDMTARLLRLAIATERVTIA